ncbi:MAG: hypothetical protein ABH835_01470, partial [Patescibacteria group bacterium]
MSKKEEELAKKLRKSQGKPEKKEPEEEEKAEILRKQTPEQKKMMTLVIITGVVIAIIGGLGLWLSIRYAEQDTWGDKFKGMREDFQGSFDGFTDNLSRYDEAFEGLEEDQVKIISNPNNYSEEEID